MHVGLALIIDMFVCTLGWNPKHDPKSAPIFLLGFLT
jgi:hypothetical protein